MTGKTASRALIYTTLLVAAVLFMAPLYVMLVTSFKDADEIRNGNLLSLPGSLNFEAWSLAWSSACTGTDCRGLQQIAAPDFIGVLERGHQHHIQRRHEQQRSHQQREVDQCPRSSFTGHGVCFVNRCRDRARR